MPSKPQLSTEAAPDRARRKPRALSRGAVARVALAAAVAVMGGAGYWWGSGPLTPQEREVTVVARKYGYEPAVIRVNKGDTLRLRFASLDVVHGFYLEGHDVDATLTPMRSAVELRHPSRPGEEVTVEEVVVKVDSEGKFRYRCSSTCGFLHPFMLGELIVGPNRLLPTSLGMTLGVLLGGLAFVMIKDEEE